MLVTRECWNDVGPFIEDLPQEGSSFLFTYKATKKQHNPQVIKNKFLHHWQTFSLHFSDWERILDRATVTMGKYINMINSEYD